MNEKENVSNALSKQGLKGAQFMVEIFVDRDNKTTFLIRTTQNIPVRMVDSPEEVAEFLHEVINEATTDNEK